jgi:NADH:ubiquinone oxidoreductase subunit K
MHGYDPAAWAAFFTAVTGAAAALTGLLFVAVSINLDRILNPEDEGPTMLPARAAETVATLLFVVTISALALVPQDVELLGAEILLIAVPLTLITVRNQLKFKRQNPDLPLLWSVSRMTASGIALIPGMIAGVSLAAHWGGGLYWLAPTALCGIAGAVYSAWILLVEIVR